MREINSMVQRLMFETVFWSTSEEKQGEITAKHSSNSDKTARASRKGLETEGDKKYLNCSQVSRLLALRDKKGALKSQ